MGATLSRRNRAGLGFAVVLGAAELAGPALPIPSFARSGPVAATIAFGTLLGAITMVSAVALLTTRSRTALRVVAASRLFSLLSAIPAFFRDVVPPGLVVVAALWVLLNLLAVELMVEPRQASTRPGRG
ncbi:hypothetical protein BL253_24205 [Pseudofrankia asymbiotica]|uniref:Uncharacterized protein n=2 Tax=Pseudofrankia asymbiotica TaxID=1834516 RepID=A0A1V2I5P9_9ACTN|nr:hypothetical protein BL253_24205 [Pseudofrankia asymbiotica]